MLAMEKTFQPENKLAENVLPAKILTQITLKELELCLSAPACDYNLTFIFVCVAYDADLDLENRSFMITGSGVGFGRKEHFLLTGSKPDTRSYFAQEVA